MMLRPENPTHLSYLSMGGSVIGILHKDKTLKIFQYEKKRVSVVGWNTLLHLVIIEVLDVDS